MRPGRLDRILYVSPPDANARKEIFQVNFRRMAINPDVDVEILTAMVSLPLPYLYARIRISESVNLVGFADRRLFWCRGGVHLPGCSV